MRGVRWLRLGSGEDKFREQMQTWASANGWSYIDEDRELPGAWPPLGIRDDRCRFVARGVFNAQPAVVCVREAYDRGSSEDSGLRRVAVIGVELPGLLPAGFAGADADRALRAMGGAAPPGYQAVGAGRWLLAERPGYHKFERLLASVDLLTSQVAIAPAEFWA